MTVFLIGFMGSGKTTLGRALGSQPGWSYVDLDELVELTWGGSVRELFASRGEEWFRREESRLLREAAGHAAAEAEIVVVGCGGGTPCHGDNMEWMNRHGLTVLLQADEEVLLRRLLEAQEQRPLLRGMDAAQLIEFIRSKQLQRACFYERARLRFNSSRLESEEEIEGSCREFLRLISGENGGSGCALRVPLPKTENNQR